MRKRLDELIHALKQKGYALYDDLDEIEPDEIDVVLTELTRAGVEMRQTPNVETEISQDSDVYADDPVRVYLREMGRVPQLSRERELELAKRMRDDEIAKKDLIEPNLRLVVAIARQCSRRDMHLLDLIQEGNIGLMKAADRFDYRHGYPFGT